MEHPPTNGRWTKPNGGINLNTTINIGLVVILIGATWTISSTIVSTKNEVITRIEKTDDHVKATDDHVSAIEKKQEQIKETWNDGDMLRWSVHFAKDNPTIKVPEPESHSGR